MHIALGLLVAFVLIVLLANRRTRACRWRQDRTKAQPGAMAWRCAACGAETVTEGVRPPRICLRVSDDER